MNTYKQLLQLCPIPECIQQLIFNILVGYGTPSANAIQSVMPNINVILKTNACLESSLSASYFSQEAIIEIHIIYLTNKPQTHARISKVKAINNYFRKITQERLIQFLEKPF